MNSGKVMADWACKCSVPRALHISIEDNFIVCPGRKAQEQLRWVSFPTTIEVLAKKLESEHSMHLPLCVSRLVIQCIAMLCSD